VGRPPTLPPGEEQLVALGVNIDGLVFDRADAYRFVIELDGSREKFLPFPCTTTSSRGRSELTVCRPASRMPDDPPDPEGQGGPSGDGSAWR
jgi:hypothetical protein